MEAYNQGRGCILYRTTLPAGPAAELSAKEARDFAWVFLDAKLAGTMDRRSRQYRVHIPQRQAAARLDILVEAMGHINFGPEVHDRKGLHGPVVLKTTGAGTVELGPWLKPGRNEVIVLDLLGPQEPVLAGLEKPVLDRLRPQLDFTEKVQQAILTIGGAQPVHAGAFASGPAVQEVRFTKPVRGRQFCLETLSALDGKPFAAIAELDLLDADGKLIPHTVWTIAYVDSEERVSEDGSALNAINGQTADFWHTEWSQSQPGHPHRLVIDLGQVVVISGFRYTPRPGDNSVSGRIKDYRVYIGDTLAKPVAQ